MRYPDDYRQTVLEAVNIEGDTDSTGAVTGNILGAMLGLSAIPEEWQIRLAEREIIQMMTAKVIERIHKTYWESKDRK